MLNRSDFSREIADLSITHTERAIAFLWFYRQTQDYEERSASELANDLHDEDFPKPNVTRLENELKKSSYTIKGKRKGTFQIDVRKLGELDDTYGKYIKLKKITASDSIIPYDWVKGTRPYLEKLVQQINASYDAGFYDACAVLCRRLMESLIVEIYIYQKRHQEIQKNGQFISLEPLIKHLVSDTSIALSRGTPKVIPEVKDIGDTAAHDRTYITRQTDIDGIKLPYARMIGELLQFAGIQP